MAPSIDLRVAELLCARICHDLIGPVGAVRNGAELLGEESVEFVREAAKLIADAGDQGAARLEFFRLAFGSAGAESTISADTVRGVAAAILAVGKVSAEWLPWPREFADGVPRNAAKLILNLMLVGIDCIPRGGVLTVGLDGNVASPRVTVTAAGTNAALPPEAADAMRPGADVAALSARTVPAYLAAQLAGAIGVQIAASEPGAGSVALRAE